MINFWLNRESEICIVIMINLISCWEIQFLYDAQVKVYLSNGVMSNGYVP